MNSKNCDMKQMILYAASGRCMCCGWPTAKSQEEGCIQGDCSYRPTHSSPDYEDWRRRTEILNKVTEPARRFVPENRATVHMEKP